MKYKTSSTMPTTLKNGVVIPLDSFIKIVLPFIGLCGEIYTGFDMEWNFIHLGNAQHSTMFSAFIICGICEVNAFYFPYMFPENLEYYFNMVGFLVELFLFAFHLHGRSDFDQYVHLLLVSLIVFTIVVGVCEIIFIHSYLAGLLRSLLVFTQGTWFIQVGAMLYPPLHSMPDWTSEKEANNPANLVQAANLLVAHFVVNLACLVLLACVFACCQRRRHSLCLGNGRIGTESGGGRGIQRGNSKQRGVNCQSLISGSVGGVQPLLLESGVGAIGKDDNYAAEAEEGELWDEEEEWKRQWPNQSIRGARLPADPRLLLTMQHGHRLCAKHNDVQNRIGNDSATLGQLYENDYDDDDNGEEEEEEDEEVDMLVRDKLPKKVVMGTESKAATERTTALLAGTGITGNLLVG